ncbi:MAG: ArsB/NhaD family transporter [Candidatus Cloacimonetes bacterium]|nr:ArsB/NhaD family transporter [Candidatus Cloacimonadota bacterium]
MVNMIIAFGIFVLAYVFIISEWINKMTIVLLGGFLLVLCKVMTQDIAFRYIDWNVIFLLIGMMIIMGVIKETGVFQFAAIKTAKIAKGSPIRIMLLLFIVTAAISAILDNVTTMMIIIPVIILITTELGISPVPFIITQILASNIGGTATLIGDPPNILIGSAVKLSFLDFVYNLTPAIIIISAISLLIIFLMYHKHMHVSNQRRARIMEYNDKMLITNKPLLIKSIVVMSLLVIGFLLEEFIHLSSATIAMSAALILLIMSNRKEVEHIITQSVDWVSLFFLIGLFMIVGGLTETGFMGRVAPYIVKATQGNLKYASLGIVWVSGFFSSILGAVPLVATMIQLIKNISGSFHTASINPLWWALALGSCLGGNFTIIGSAANIVSVGIAKRNGYPISFWTFMRYSFVITLMSLVISTLYIYVRYF